MALFGRKKEDASAPLADSDETVVVKSADPEAMSFTPQPEKARAWFAHARTAAESGNHAYALTCFANGIKFDPEDMEAHRGMYDSAVRHHHQKGKPAKSSEISAIEGPHPVEKFAAAEFAWARNITNSSLALRVISGAVKADQREFGRWFAPKLLGVLAKQKKPSKKEFLAAMEDLSQVGAWDEALKAGAKALEVDPTDAGLSAQLKNLSAQRAMDRGGYEDAGGAEGGFRKFVRDEDRQRELEEEEAFSGAGGSEERALARAKAAFEENTADTEAASKYIGLLRRSGKPEHDEQAKQAAMRAFRDSKEYRFKMVAGDITMRQGERRAAELAARAAANPDDVELREDHEQMVRQLLMYKSAEYAERVEKYPSDRSMRYQLGMIEYELGNYENAMGAFQQSKDEPKLRVSSGHMLGQCFAREGWHREAIGEFKEALESIDATSRDRELDIRYDLMVSLIEQARRERSLDEAREALEICSGIARKNITYRDIRARRKEIDQLIQEINA